MDLIAILLAHAGDWATSLVYLAPVALVVGALLVQSRRDRRRDVAREADAATRRDDDAPHG